MNKDLKKINTGKIPKIIHQVWLSGEIVPKKLRKFSLKWQHLHPNWKYIFWQSSDIKKLKFFNLDDYGKLNNYAEKTDYLRFCILLEFGGVYIDMDFEPLKSIEELIAPYSFFIGERPEGGVEIAILGSEPGNNLIQQIFKLLHGRISETQDWGKDSSSGRIGPCWLSQFFREKNIGEVFENNCIIFPKKYFYPIPWKFFARGKLRKPISNFDLSESYGIHHYDAHWISQWFSFKKIIYNTPLIGGLSSRLRKIFKLNL